MGAGVAAAAVALGATQLLAAFFSPAADARNAVATSVVDLTPGPVKEWAIQLFGTSDKLFLSWMVVIVILFIAAVAALWERPRRPVGSLVIAAAGVLGCAAVLAQPGAKYFDILPTVVGTACGIGVLRLLTATRAAKASPGEDDGIEAVDPGRRLSLAALGFTAAGLAAGIGGTVLGRARWSVARERDSQALPAPKNTPPPMPGDVNPKGVTLPSFITPNEKFYRIDTAITVPQVARADWTLRIHGMVDREITYTFDDLKQFEPIQKTVTLTCVSNPVGGNLISNATWLGYRVRDLLRSLKIYPEADMVLSTSIDGFTAGTPLQALTDDRDSLLAIGMNGVPLPVEHGYPARLVVPGLYGFVSATKWVVDLEITRFDKAKAYWTTQGWAAKAPIKTQSRIDVPRDFQSVRPGPNTFGGVAWAQNRGIKAVEVRIDDGPWQPATLGASYSNDAWRLWSFNWTAKPGSHTMSVRATDNTGAVQTGDAMGVIPDGATGWHTVSFDVG